MNCTVSYNKNDNPDTGEKSITVTLTYNCTDSEELNATEESIKRSISAMIIADDEKPDKGEQMVDSWKTIRERSDSIIKQHYAYGTPQSLRPWLTEQSRQLKEMCGDDYSIAPFGVI